MKTRSRELVEIDFVNIEVEEVTQQVEFAGEIYGYAQERKGAVSVSRNVNESTWKIVNVLGKHHSPSDFRAGEIVWVDLANHLYLAKILKVSHAKGLHHMFRVCFLDDDGSVKGGGNCELEQLVKQADWNGLAACPFPRFDMLKH